jgi:hypothetical protein
MEMPKMKVPPRQLTNIEKVVREADAADGHPGYHVTLKYPDGSQLDAPIFDVGPNWARFADLRVLPLMVDTADAEIEINWSPGPAEASGPRFDYLNALAASPKV